MSWKPKLRRPLQNLSFTQSIVDTVREPLLVLDGTLRVRRANRSFYEKFHVSPEHTQGILIYELGNRQWDIPALRKLLEEVLPHNTVMTDFLVEHDFPVIGQKAMLLNALVLPAGWLLSSFAPIDRRLFLLRT